MKKITRDKKITKEKRIVKQMIEIYCNGHHHPQGLCLECQELVKYTSFKIDKCPFMETKTFCNNCKVHCYQKEQKEKIKKVMRYSGPRMMYYHPIVAISHIFSTWRKK